MDLSVLCGHRNEAEQMIAYNNGFSLVRWPLSRHNSYPSEAVDVAPYYEQKPHYDFDDILAFARLAGVVLTVAHNQGVALRWGGDWNRDGRSRTETFLDLGHFELY